MSTENPHQNLIDRLFAAGAHYGFSKSRRHPSTSPFIFGSKEGNDIFDLTKTAILLEDAKTALETAGKNGKTVMFVGTKDEASKLVKKTAEATEMPYVTNRWIGGMLTNFTEIRKRIERLKSLRTEKESGELERKYIKKERVVIGREMDKLIFNFGGIVEITKTPDIMVVIDPRYEHIAVAEAHEKGIPIIGVMSSDSNIKQVTHAVLVNDALAASITLVLNELAASLEAGKKAFVPAPTRTDDRTRRPRPTTN